MNNIFRDNDQFVAVYIDDILVFSKNKKKHIGHFQIVLKKFEEHGIIISKSKIQLFHRTIEFLGVIIGNSKILLQQHISEKIITFPDKIEETKELHKYLGLLNYARPFIKNLSRITGLLFSKVGSKGQKYFNQKDIKLVKTLKELVTKLPPLELPLINDYLIIETDGCSLGRGAVLLAKSHKFSAKITKKICRYSSGKYKENGNISSIDTKVLAITYAIDSFRILIISKKEILIRIECETIVKVYRLKNEKRYSQRRWLNFTERIINTGVKIEIEHIKGKDNNLADSLSRLIN